MVKNMISIIVPVYNAEKYIERCVDSILSNNTGNFELILVDDGSSDQSPSLCDRYATEDNRVVVHHQVNGGASAARNKGIDLANGEWVVFVDADDEVSLDMIEKIEASPLSEVDIVFWGYRMIFHDRIVENIPPMGLIEENEYSTVFTKCEIYTPWSKAFRKELITKNNLQFDLKLKNGEDTLFMFQFLNNTNKAFLIKNTLYTHYVLNSSLSARIVPYALNVSLLQQIVELSDIAIHKFKLNKEACEKIMELQSVCIGRIINMNIPKGKMYRNRAVLEKLDLALYGKYLHPKTIKGKVHKFLVVHKMWHFLDYLNRIIK